MIEKNKIIQIENIAQVERFIRPFLNDSKMLLPLLAGSLSAFAFIFTVPIILAISYSLFILSLVNKPVKVADRVGLFFGFSQFFIGLFWFFKIEDPYLANSHLILQGFGLLAIFLMSLLFAVLAVFVTIIPISRRNNTVWFALVVPSSFALMEWVKTIYFTGFPWFQASHVFTGSIFSGWYAIFGEIGVSFIFYFFVSMFCDVVMAKDRKKKAQRYLLLLILFAGLTFIAGKIDYSVSSLKKNVESNSVNVLLIHGDSSLIDKKSYSGRVERMLRYQEKVLSFKDIDISIWPESAAGTGVYQDISEKVSLGFSQIEANNSRVFFGGYAREGMFVKNSIFSSNEKKEIYVKQHLAPVGEYIPMWFTMFDVWIPGTFQGSTVTDGGRDSHADNQLIYANTVMTPIICYEVLFNEELRRRSQKSGVLVVVSDLEAVEYSWVKNYFFNLARIRAMELQKPTLVSSNKGVSGIITKKGMIVQKKRGDEGLIINKIWPEKILTPFARFGNDLILVVLVLVLLIGVGVIVFPVIKRK